MRKPAQIANAISVQQLRWALAALVAAVAVGFASPSRAGVGEISQVHAVRHAA
jgi:hypothetical protein